MSSANVDRKLNYSMGSRAEDVDVSAADYTASQNVSLFIGTGGDIKVDLVDGGTVTFKNIFDGTFLPIVVDKVYNADTTASDIIAIW